MLKFKWFSLRDGFAEFQLAPVTVYLCSFTNAVRVNCLRIRTLDTDELYDYLTMYTRACPVHKCDELRESQRIHEHFSWALDYPVRRIAAGQTLYVYGDQSYLARVQFSVLE